MLLREQFRVVLPSYNTSKVLGSRKNLHLQLAIYSGRCSDIVYPHYLTWACGITIHEKLQNFLFLLHERVQVAPHQKGLNNLHLDKIKIKNCVLNNVVIVVCCGLLYFVVHL